jgi:hypothetical protein
MKTSRLIVLLVVSSAGSLRASEPSSSGRLAEAERRYAEQESILRDPSLSREQRARTLEYLGLSWLILERPARARAAFEELLAIAPRYALTDPSRSPKLDEFFEGVRAKVVHRSGPPESGRPATRERSTTPIEPKPPSPWYTRWYVWTVAGVVVVAVIAGVAIGVTEGQAPTGTLPPGKVTLGLELRF